MKYDYAKSISSKAKEFVFEKNKDRLQGKEFDHHFFLRRLDGAFSLRSIPVSLGIIKGNCYFYAYSNNKGTLESDITPINVINMELGNENFVNLQRIGTTLFTNGIHTYFFDSFQDSQEFFKIIKNLKENYITYSKSDIENTLNSNYYLKSSKMQHISSNDKKIINERIIQLIDQKNINLKDANVYNLDLVEKKSLEVMNDLMLEKNMTNYGVVDVTRTTNNKVDMGTYVYSFCDDNSLKIMKNPLVTLINSDGNVYHVFDKKNYQDAVESFQIIDTSSIKDFHLFGTELMQSSVETVKPYETLSTVNNPKLFGTMLSEVFFGQSYTTLKGMSKMMESFSTLSRINIKTTHTIKDTRVVQVIFNDGTDIEFKGVSIYYDFNRLMGSIKNKKIENKDKKETHGETSINKAEKIREYKALLDEGLIDEEEFKQLKKELIK